ncbi:MAG: holo-ACP synthase [Caulobacteraceae bacterium]|nr:holo-ACP synthase [Caulobacteraceae bacterium]
MIVGLGSDLCDIRRIQSSLDRFGDRFIGRVYTEVERRKCESRADRAGGYARRFAAKEAGAKALGTGIARGVSWKEIGVVNLPGGRPTLALTGKAAERLAALMPPGHVANVHVSLTDDHPYAMAFVVIEALPAATSP